MQGIEDLPPGTLPFEDNKRFVRFPRGRAYTAYAEINGCVQANAVMEFFDCGFNFGRENSIQTSFHEASHYIGDELGLDEMDKWRELSGWEVVNRPDGNGGTNSYWETTKAQCMVSAYGFTNPTEDFSESMVAYRYNPGPLKKNCPEKYKFLKDLVFRGIEYTDPKLCENKKIDGSLTDSLKWHLKKIKYQLN
ncbi:hypothetical protein [Bdellovibrio sp. HCB288]|uniref:hypothetical protein n=1 Tax=Bdellovibrio sp. HCB288 TaxID=3394355 RepID=UPI0039B6A354